MHGPRAERRGASPSSATVLLGKFGQAQAAVRLGFLVCLMGLTLVPVGQAGREVSVDPCAPVGP